MAIEIKGDCGISKNIGTLKKCQPLIFTSEFSEVYFNPETKEVFHDKEMKCLIGHGIYDEENKTLQITKTLHNSEGLLN